jgi:Flp pilus assembly protein TadG
MPDLRPRIGERAQALAELAVLVPILFLLIIVATDFGRFYYAQVTVTNGARTGAQYGSASAANAGDLPGIQAAANGDMANLSGATISKTTGNDATGNPYVRVTVTYAFSPIFDWPVLPGSVDIERSVQMRVAP